VHASLQKVFQYNKGNHVELLICVILGVVTLHLVKMAPLNKWHIWESLFIGEDGAFVKLFLHLVKMAPLDKWRIWESIFIGEDGAQAKGGGKGGWGD